MGALQRNGHNIVHYQTVDINLLLPLRKPIWQQGPVLEEGLLEPSRFELHVHRYTCLQTVTVLITDLIYFTLPFATYYATDYYYRIRYRSDYI